jgi:hypothetical protein
VGYARWVILLAALVVADEAAGGGSSGARRIRAATDGDPRYSSGSTYAPLRRTPKCSCGTGWSAWPHPVVATACPRATWSPRRTITEVRYEHVLSTPPPWSIVRNSRPPTLPANDTTPPSGATITLPTGTDMSIPRCPAP